jgi:hypothetical protein
MVAELTTEKAGEFIGASLPSNDKQTLVLLLLRAFRSFYGFDSYRMGETRHTIIPSLLLAFLVK